MTSKTTNKFSPEVRERAVRLFRIADHQRQSHGQGGGERGAQRLPCPAASMGGGTAFAWIFKNRCLVRAYEQITAVAQTLITIAASDALLRRWQ